MALPRAVLWHSKTKRGPMRILLVEDNRDILANLADYLELKGYRVDCAQDGLAGLNLAVSGHYDLIVLDVMLPGLDGYSLCRRLREDARQETPVIMLTARDQLDDRLQGFKAGADDYLIKPFALSELTARIEAVLRRVAYERQLPQACLGDGLLCFDEPRADVRHGAAWAGLTSTEYRLLELLWRHAEEVLSKPFLYQQVLRRAYSRHDRSLDMHVSNIRRKLQRIEYAACRLESVWGKGYLLTGLER